MTEPDNKQERSPDEPFLYESLVKILDGPEPFDITCVTGGRHLGKSAILRRIDAVRHRGSQKMAGEEQPSRGLITPRELLLAGSDRDALLSRYHEAKSEGWILIDDWDRVIRIDAEQVCRVLLDVLKTEFMGEEKIPLVLSARVPVSRWHELLMSLHSVSADISELVESIHEESLLDHLAGWKAEFARQLGDSLKRASIDRAAQDQIVKAVTGVMAKLTGGHPALVGPAYRMLVSLLMQSPTQASPANLSDEKWLWRLLEEFLLLDRGGGSGLQHARRSPMSALRRRVAELRNSRAQMQRKAYWALLHLAKHEPVTVSATVKEVLLGTGLVFTQEGALTIPGALLRDEVISSYRNADQSAVSPPSAPEMKLVPDPNPAGSEGDLVVQTAQERRVVHLRGNVWRLLQLLFEHRDSIVTWKMLMDRFGLEDGEASRRRLTSVKKRLRVRLKRAGIEGVIRSVYREGYKLGTRAITLRNETRAR